MCVHGVPVKLSPVKKSRSGSKVFYFDGQISDGRKCVTIVSFDMFLLPVLEKVKKEEVPLALDKRSKQVYW